MKEENHNRCVDFARSLEAEFWKRLSSTYPGKVPHHFQAHGAVRYEGSQLVLEATVTRFAALLEPEQVLEKVENVRTAMGYPGKTVLKAGFGPGSFFVEELSKDA